MTKIIDNEKEFLDLVHNEAWSEKTTFASLLSSYLFHAEQLIKKKIPKHQEDTGIIADPQLSNKWIADFAEKFEVFGSTIRRWASGTSKPAFLVQTQAISYITAELQKQYSKNSSQK